MATKKVLGKDFKDRYFRNLGWKQTPKGYVQQKFYLGRDEAKAKLANLRLEQLWQQVSRRWERAIGYPPAHQKKLPGPKVVDLGDGLPATKAVVSIGAVRHVDLHGDRPTWNEETLTIADAIRNGESVAYLRLPSDLAVLPPEHPLTWDWLDRLRNDITGIKIELQDEVGQRISDEQIHNHGQRLIEKGRRMQLRKAGGPALHAAMAAFSKWVESKYVNIETQKVTYWGATQTRIITFVKRHLPDCTLQELDARRVEELLDILKNRPPSEDGKPISVAWAKSCIKLFRSFLRWLNRAQEFEWKRPTDLETTPIRVPLTPREKSTLVRSVNVDTYSLAELTTLWEYASPFQRLLMLLALNCGFGRAEVASLEIHEILLHQKHPHDQELGFDSIEKDSWVLRVRQKTGVYGEYKLWPDTVKAIEWWTRQRAQIAVAEKVATLLVTRKGNRYDTPTKGNHQNYQIPNGWYALAKRIRDDKEKERQNFRTLSFNKLRKTAGNFIRRESGGEIAGVFLGHGTPVRSDDLLDRYTNRPFAKVFEAIELVGLKLRTIWESVSEPFPEKRSQGGPNISQGTIRKIQNMRRQGYKLRYIAARLNVSVETARRWGKRSKDAIPTTNVDP